MEHMRDDSVIDLREQEGINPDALGQHDSVVAALAAHYEAAGWETHQLWIADLDDGISGMFDVWVPGLNRLIDVETADTLGTLDPHRYGPWRAAHYDVWVMAPQDKMETTLRRLTKAVDHIHPWHLDGPKVVFPELAPR